MGRHVRAPSIHRALARLDNQISSRLSFFGQAGASEYDRQTPIHHKTYHTPSSSRNQPKGFFSPLPTCGHPYWRHHTANGSPRNQSKS